MRKIIGQWRLGVYSVAVILFAFLIMGKSESFHECFHSRKNDGENQDLRDPNISLESVFVRAQFNGICIGYAIDRNGELITALSTVFIACFTLTLKRSTDRLWIAGREAFEASERAFVFIDGFNIELTVYADGYHDHEELAEFSKSHNANLWVTRFAAQPRWKNGGNTPTKNMTVQIGWRVPGGTLSADFHYQPRGSKIPFFLAPRSTEPTDFFEIHGANEIINNGLPHIGVTPMMFIWGRADYQDVFDNWHFTQWCYHIRFERHGRGRLNAQFIQWGDYNRTDESGA